MMPPVASLINIVIWYRPMRIPYIILFVVLVILALGFDCNTHPPLQDASLATDAGADSCSSPVDAEDMDAEDVDADPCELWPCRQEWPVWQAYAHNCLAVGQCIYIRCPRSEAPVYLCYQP